LQKPRVLVADDHRLVLERVLSLLQSDFEVVGTASNGNELILEAERLQPDLIVLDITMPELNGIEAARKLNALGCMAKLVFLTVHQDSEFVQACMAEGALGYVTKARMTMDLISAINQAICGNFFVSPLGTH